MEKKPKDGMLDLPAIDVTECPKCGKKFYEVKQTWFAGKRYLLYVHDVDLYRGFSTTFKEKAGCLVEIGEDKPQELNFDD